MLRSVAVDAAASLLEIDAEAPEFSDQREKVQTGQRNAVSYLCNIVSAALMPNLKTQDDTR